MTNSPEFRDSPAGPRVKDCELRYAQLRAEGDDSVRRLVGHAAVFNIRTDIGGFFEEQIRPGAFSEAIRNDDVRALIDHDSSLVLGRNTAGTLQLSEDDRGLRVEITPPDTQIARDLIVSMERGDINQMSFGFSMRGGIEEWDETGETQLRTIEKVGRLIDVSVVTFPAFPDAEVGLRSLNHFRTSSTPPVDRDRLRRRLALIDAEISR